MRYFTEDEIAALKSVEHHFVTVTKFNFKHNSKMSDNELIAAVYKAAGGNLGAVAWGCPYCCFKAWKKVAEWYYKSIDNLPKEDESLIKWDTQDTPKKPGRKSKQSEN